MPTKYMYFRYVAKHFACLFSFISKQRQGREQFLCPSILCIHMYVVGFSSRNIDFDLYIFN